MGHHPTSLSYSREVCKGSCTRLRATQNTFLRCPWAHSAPGVRQGVHEYPVVLQAPSCRVRFLSTVLAEVHRSFNRFSWNNSIGFREEWASLPCPKRKGYNVPLLLGRRWWNESWRSEREISSANPSGGLQVQLLVAAGSFLHGPRWLLFLNSGPLYLYPVLCW